jgi:queuine tRNA-ribosyltransferase
MSFTIHHRDAHSSARTATLDLPHGPVDLPAFMPVGTAATVKAITHHDVARLGFRLILGNTYHLWLRPGVETIKTLGGLHGFSTWDGNILTDSGGFQVFSLASLRRITKGGVTFRSHIDGSAHEFTPERVVEAQVGFGSDIQMVLDVCSGYGTPRDEVVRALECTTQWASRARRRWQEACAEGYRGRLFGIVQGGFDAELRKQSAQEIGELSFPGVAIGGLSVGEPKEVFQELLCITAPMLPPEVPHYLMGIGTPDYIFDAVTNGIDMFDCVFPTRIARNGTVFTRDGRLVLRHEAHTSDHTPIDPTCGCSVCARYSRGYLRHLFKSGEILGPMLATHHNLAFMAELMQSIREAIATDAYTTFAADFMERYEAGERERLGRR